MTRSPQKRRPLRGRGWYFLVGGLLLSACSPTPETMVPSPAELPSALPAFGIPPAVSINAVMVAVVDHSAHYIWDLGREGAAPETAQDWQEVEHHAIQLAAGGSWIATGGTGEADAGWVKQTTWKDYAQEMTDAAVVARRMAEGEDLAGVLAAGDRLIEACEACHLEFKPELPTEGIVHAHY